MGGQSDDVTHAIDPGETDSDSPWKLLASSIRVSVQLAGNSRCIAVDGLGAQVESTTRMSSRPSVRQKILTNSDVR